MVNTKLEYPNYPTDNVFPFEDSNTPLIQYPIPKDRPVRIYCDGIYDLFHYGHALSLKQAKNLFKNVYLLVGVCNDTLTHKYKGKTVLKDIERYETLLHCKYVDQVIRDAPWIPSLEFLEQHQIDYIAHDDMFYPCEDITDCYEYVKKANKFIPTMRTKNISTSTLITRIVKDYDEYVRRNLLRGIPAKELNISYFDEKKFKIKQKVKLVKRRAKTEINELRSELSIALEFWEKMGKDFVRSFERTYEKLKKVIKRDNSAESSN